MIIYNVTVKVDWDISADWAAWMKEIHMPEVMSTGCFEKCQFVRLLQVDETDGPTYAAQYYAASLGKYDDYIHRFSSDLRQKTMDKWGDQFIAFRTLMEVDE